MKQVVIVAAKRTPIGTSKYYFFDVGVVGEAFRTWPELIRAGRDYQDLQGIIYRRGEEVVMNDARPVIHDLDELPFPAWELFQLEGVYFKNSQALFSQEIYECKRRIDINASYGCSLICRSFHHQHPQPIRCLSWYDDRLHADGQE